MKQLIKLATFFLIVVCVFASCIKDKPATSSPISNNKSPIANAGVDQTIMLPTDSVELSGSGTDPDGNIVSYSWSQISGPALFFIVNPNNAVVKLKNLLVGVYEFELKVTDNGGLTAKDKVQVIVNQSNNSCSGMTDSIYITTGNVRMIPFGQLSQARSGLVSATAGNKIIFAAGNECRDGRWNASTRVDIFDMITQTWTTAELSESRSGFANAVVGNKILIAGGINNQNQVSGRVDIYDASTNLWSTVELSIARGYIASATIGNKAFFAGGTTGYANPKSSRVDIYDASTNTWSTAELSEGRLAIAATTLGNKLFFAGGYTDEDYWDFVGTSKRVDIYNNATTTWSTEFLSEGRGAIAAITLNNKVFFAGGFNDNGASHKVDIYDNNLQNWSTATLSLARFCIQVATLGDRILFANGANQKGEITRMDIYDGSSNTWTTADLNLPLTGSTVIRAGNHVYVAGGSSPNARITNKVWRIEF